MMNERFCRERRGFFPRKPMVCQETGQKTPGMGLLKYSSNCSCGVLRLVVLAGDPSHVVFPGPMRLEEGGSAKSR